MSSNKTQIPGMDPASTSSFTQSSASMNIPNEQGKRGTVIPGMQQSSDKTVSTTKPILGFLYSVSRIKAGEFWPLHLGLNTIGRSGSCDIKLAEGTVSEHHADLVIRQMKNPAKTICSIQDAKSTCGTMINDESVAFDPVACKNGDIITIGEHYQCYLVLIDSKELGLGVREDFISCEDASDDDSNPFDMFKPDFDPYRQPDTEPNFTKGTVDLSGNNPFKSGGTRTL